MKAFAVFLLSNETFRIRTCSILEIFFSQVTFERKLSCMSLPSQDNSRYLRQGGYVHVVVRLSVCLSVCLLATVRKNFQMDLHEFFREG